MGWVEVKKRVSEELTAQGLACVERSSNSQSREYESGFGTAEWRMQGRICKYIDGSRRVQLVKGLQAFENGNSRFKTVF